MRHAILDTLGLSAKPTKTPWHPRFAPGAILRQIGLIAGIGTLFGLLFAGLLFAPLMPHLEAQSSGTTSTNSTPQLQHGDQVQWIKPIIEGGKRLPWRKIGRWIGVPGVGYAVGVGSNATWDGIKKEWRLPPGSASKGTVEARADVWLSKVDGEHTHWYTKSGEWAWRKVWRYDLNGVPIYNTYVETANKIRNYHYIDYSFTQMVWDEDNEIWKSDPDTHQRIYNTNGYDPDLVNTYRNNGEQGKYYPDHEDYRKGKKGYFIWIGDNVKNYLEHEFRSTISSGKDKDLAGEAEDPKYKKDKFNPIVLVTLDDMTYKADGWNYKRRAEKTFIQRELSAVENDSAALVDEFIPLNTRWVKEEYQYNISIVYWKVETKWTRGDIRVGRADEVFEDQTIPEQYEVPEQQIDTW